jgi:uncharacterized SAM-binding protein YcdF (DUF218 family)
MTRAMGLRLLGLVGVLGFAVSAFTQVPNLLAALNSPRPRLAPADAIVVLGGGIHPDGALTNGSLRRAVYGVSLQRSGLAKFLVLLGPSRSAGPAEARVRAEIARELGIAPEAILTEENARTTGEEAAAVGAILRPRGVHRIILVTDSQHISRAQRLFERAGFEVLPAPADDFSSAAVEPEERLRLMRRITQEILARLYYRLVGYL